MMFVDTNVFMYAVGQEHPLQHAAQKFFTEAKERQIQLFTSAEVLQELMHVYMSRRRTRALAEAMDLVEETVSDVWSLEKEDVELARQLHNQYPMLSARDLCHLASCRRRGVSQIKTFDQAFQAVVGDALERSQ